MVSLLSKQHAKVYDTLADDYEKNIPNYYEPTRTAIEILAKNLPPSANILDVGCGAGLASELLYNKGFKITSMDLSPNMIAYTKKRNPNGRAVVGDFLTHKFQEEFDAIIALAFIHLFPKKTAKTIVKKMYKLIKPGGFLYIGTTKSDVSKEGWELKKDSFFPESVEKRYRKHWTEDELKETLCGGGFKFKELHLIDDPRHKTWMDFLMLRSYQND